MENNRVIVMRSGKDINVIVNGQTFYLHFDEAEDAIKEYKHILEKKNSGKEEDIEYLLKYLSPQYRLAELGGILQRDRLGNYYLGGYNEPLPNKLKEMIIEHVDNDLPLEGLVNFWKLLMLNPDKHVRKSLFDFASNFRMPITDNGYFIAYKSVAWKGESNRQIGVFVSSRYVDLKAKGRPTKGLLVINMGNECYKLMTPEEFKDYTDNIVTSTKELKIRESAWKFLEENDLKSYKLLENQEVTDEELVTIVKQTGPWTEPTDSQILSAYMEDRGIKVEGELEDLFKNINNFFDHDSPVFTDWHTMSSTIKLGEPVQMPREDCNNDPNVTCSKGLHVGAPGYVSRFGFGDENYILACLVNPMHVVAVPYDYNGEKMRTCEYLPYAVCEMEDGVIKELDTNYFEEDYINYEKELLEKELSELDLNEEGAEEKERLLKDRLVVIN